MQYNQQSCQGTVLYSAGQCFRLKPSDNTAIGAYKLKTTEKSQSRRLFAWDIVLMTFYRTVIIYLLQKSLQIFVYSAVLYYLCIRKNDMGKSYTASSL